MHEGIAIDMPAHVAQHFDSHVSRGAVCLCELELKTRINVLAHTSKTTFVLWPAATCTRAKSKSCRFSFAAGSSGGMRSGFGTKKASTTSSAARAPTSVLLTVTVTLILVPEEIETVEASADRENDVYERPRPNG
jgi:hypothetical protein